MADDNSTPPAGAAPSDHCDVLNGLLNLKGAIRLSREAVYRQMGTNDDLVSAEGVLHLAEKEMERLYAMVDCPAIAKAWPSSIGEVAYG
ncbi:MAG: hypothetical protein JWN43_1602 [Gammaproteobacteria bacterium]|nr:hypothetical protein [Gammaproteobacteria bacterium]